MCPCTPTWTGPAVPEMQRADLAATVLQLKALGVDNIMTFEWLAPPPAEASMQSCGCHGGAAGVPEAFGTGVRRRAAEAPTDSRPEPLHPCPPPLPPWRRP